VCSAGGAASSDLLAEVEHTVDRLLLTGAGRIVADGPVASLLGSDGFSVRSTDPAALASDLVGKGASVSPGDDGALVVSGASPTDVGAVAAAGGHVLSELGPLQRGLEDVFFSLTAA
jgi:ABC-2 type transport system ATP-binding protein